MSSDSEEDFLSADEGSDLESDLKPEFSSQPTSVVQGSKVCSLKEHIFDPNNDDLNEVSGNSNIASLQPVSVDDSLLLLKDNEETKLDKKSELNSSKTYCKSNDEVVHENLTTFADKSCVNFEKTILQKDFEVPEVQKCNSDLFSVHTMQLRDVLPKSATCVDSEEKCIPCSGTESYSLTASNVLQIFSKEPAAFDDLPKNESKDILDPPQLIKDLPVLSNNIVTESVLIDEVPSAKFSNFEKEFSSKIIVPDKERSFQTKKSLETASEPFVSKPIKTSKIGLKKPREKIGERLGAKKLATKLNKPLEGISCDSFQQNTEKVEETNNGCKTMLLSQDIWEEIESFDVQQLQNQSVCTENNFTAEASGGWGSASGGWGSAWGGWGSSLRSAASTITQEVSRGVGSVVELVEDGLGVPSPEELAHEARERERMLAMESVQWDADWTQHPTTYTAPTSSESSLPTSAIASSSEFTTSISTDAGANSSSNGSSGRAPSAASSRSAASEGSSRDATAAAGDGTGSGTSTFGLGFGGLTSLVAGVSGALETAGSKVVVGGLDTLELLGRRTMAVLQETDPHLKGRKQRLADRINRPSLAAVLREARERAVANPIPDPSENNSTGICRVLCRVTFAHLWDNSTGPAHMEALALMSRQCAASTREVVAGLPPALRLQAETLNREIMSLSELDEQSLSKGNVFAERVAAAVADLRLPLCADAITECWTDLSRLSEQYCSGSPALEESILAIDTSISPSTCTPSNTTTTTVESNVVGGCVCLVERLVAVAHKAAEICLTSTGDEDAHEPRRLAETYRELAVLGGSALEGCADAVCTALSGTPQQDALTPLITNIYMQVCEGSSCLQQSLVYLCTTLQLVQVQRIAETGGK